MLNFLSNVSTFDFFFLSMIFIAGIAAVIVLVPKFIKDMYSEHKSDRKHNQAVRNTFRTNRNTGAMATRNK